MIALFILLSAVAITLFINSLATQALVLTGLSKDAARFQARSVTTGTGFTTQESESLVNHPTRRRIVMLLMIVQNAGLITVISTLVLSFMNTSGDGMPLMRMLVLCTGIAVLIFLAKNDWVKRHVNRFIDWLLEEYTSLRVIDYHNMLNLHQGYTVSRITVNEDSWLGGKPLQELDLQSEGIIVLGIDRSDGSTIGAPKGNDSLSPGDDVTLYGEENSLVELSERRKETKDEDHAAHKEGSREKSHEERDVVLSY